MKAQGEKVNVFSPTVSDLSTFKSGPQNSIKSYEF